MALVTAEEHLSYFHICGEGQNATYVLLSLRPRPDATHAEWFGREAAEGSGQSTNLVLSLVDALVRSWTSRRTHLTVHAYYKKEWA